MEHRDVHDLFQPLFDVEAFRRLDVFQVDAAKGGLQQFYRLDDGIGVMGVELQVENVNVCKPFEEDALAFHDRLPGEGADVPQPQHCGAVGDHCHQIPSNGVIVRFVGILLDLSARVGNARRIRHGEISLGDARL